jgi:hypothetical protein
MSLFRAAPLSRFLVPLQSEKSKPRPTGQSVTDPLAEAVRYLDVGGQVYIRMVVTKNQSGEQVLRGILIDVFPQEWLTKAKSPVAALPLAPLKYQVDDASTTFIYVHVDSRQVTHWFTGPGEYSLLGYDPRSIPSRYSMALYRQERLMTGNRAVVYTRVSTPKQSTDDKESLPAQERACRAVDRPEAVRVVQARLSQNRQYSPRSRNTSSYTVLSGGGGRCAYCGHVLVGRDPETKRVTVNGTFEIHGTVAVLGSRFRRPGCGGVGGDPNRAH